MEKHKAENILYKKGTAVVNLLAALVLFIIFMLIIGSFWRSSKEKQAENHGENRQDLDIRVPGEPDLPRRFAMKRIDPSSFKHELQRIESLLYEKHAATYKDAGEIEHAVTLLSKKLGQSRRQWVRSLSFEVLILGSNIGGEADVGIGMIPAGARQRWIKQWRKLLRTRFKPAPWLKGSQLP